MVKIDIPIEQIAKNEQGEAVFTVSDYVAYVIPIGPKVLFFQNELENNAEGTPKVEFSLEEEECVMYVGGERVGTLIKSEYFLKEIKETLLDLAH